MNSDQINPYAPTTETSLDLPKPKLSAQVSTTSVWAYTLFGIILGGAIFGFGTAIVIFIASGEYEPEMLLLPLMFLVAGAIWAGVVGLVVTAIAVAIAFVTSRKRLWRPRGIYLFAGISGGASGMMALALPSGFDFSSIFWGTVPAVVGAGTACLMVRGRARLARQPSHQQQMDDVFGQEDNSPLSIETPAT